MTAVIPDALHRNNKYLVEGHDHSAQAVDTPTHRFLRTSCERLAKASGHVDLQHDFHGVVADTFGIHRARPSSCLP